MTAHVPHSMQSPNTYRDTGCKLWPRCLECPFPDCIIDQDSEFLRRQKDGKGHNQDKGICEED
jgi:hypothetical protein